jgi:hypothetical protein
LRRAVQTIWLLPALAGGLCAQKPGISARDLYFEAAEAAATPAHLGLRYNLLKVDPSTRATQAVDPDQNFKEGDCFAVEFASNQNGRMYVFNLASSGEWQVLMPSSQMPGETGVVQANKAVKLPHDFCFRVDAKRGVETLMVAIAGGPEGVDAAQAREWQASQVTGRDVILEKQAGSVYAVETASAANGHVVLEIKIRHE